MSDEDPTRPPEFRPEFLPPVDPEDESLGAARKRLAWYDTMLALADAHPYWRGRWEAEREVERVGVELREIEAACDERGEAPPDNAEWCRALGRKMQAMARSTRHNLNIARDQDPTPGSMAAAVEQWETVGRELELADDPVTFVKCGPLDEDDG